MDEDIRIEYEIAKLSKNEDNIYITSTKVKKEYFIEITIPQTLIADKVFNSDITFVLHVHSDKFPIIPPRLFCVTLFCFPQIADGRDLFHEVIQGKWNERMHLTSLLALLPEFINNYFTRKNTLFIGGYYLDQKYDLKLLEKSNFDIRSVKENMLIKGKWIKFPRLLLISDVYFCLFDQDKKNKNKLTLVFWASINTIAVIKKILVNKIVFIHWAQKNTNEPYEMNLSIDKGEEIVDQLVNSMNYFGMNYNVTKEIKGQAPKIINTEIEDNAQNITGEYSSSNNSNREREREREEEMSIDIGKLEDEIAKIETLLSSEDQDAITSDVLQLLNNYYEQAEYYYEQKDKTKFEMYIKKKEELLNASKIFS